MATFKCLKFEKSRYSFSKNYSPREWNNKRLAAAKRALKKEQEKAGLFPELMRFNSVDERINQIDNSVIQRVKEFRSSVAKDFWKCRKIFNTLPQSIKNDVVAFWNKSSAPKEPFRLLSLINRWHIDPLYFEREKGNASKFTQTIISNGTLKVIEVSEDEYWSNINHIDSNKR